MGHIKNGAFISGYEGQRQDVLFGLVEMGAQLPDPQGFIGDCVAAQEAAEAAQEAAENAVSDASSYATNAANSASYANARANAASASALEAYAYAQQAGAHTDLPIIRGTGGTNPIIVGNIVSNIADRDYAYAEGSSTSAIGKAAHAEGDGTTASANGAHSEGNNTSASGVASHAEGSNTTANKTSAHAEGVSTTASGEYGAHAEGNETNASGNMSHAEGYNTTASGGAAHAEGGNTTASGNNSHAEGDHTTASGNNSHAEGFYTTANGGAQHVFGMFNVPVASFIEIVGNGSSDNNRSNARTLDWQGNEILAGKLTLGALPTGAMDAVPRCLVTNPNLLDNAYFVGGGGGYGVFPVNQRGQTQYSGGNAKIFDRWTLGAGGGSAELLSDGDGVKFTFSGAAWQNLTQIVENGAALAGEIVTFSALVNTTVDLPVRLRWASGGGNYVETIPAGTNGLYSFEVEIGSTVDALSVSIGSLSTAIASGYFTLKAVKLERGSIQTLAHQESGAWVPNETPRYDDELRKCQAYLQIIKPTGTEGCLLGSGYVDSGANAKRALFTVPLSVPMRPITSVTSTGVGAIQTGVGNKIIEAIALFCQTSTLATLNATLTTAISSPPYAALTAYVLNSGSVIISAEI